MTRRTVEDFVVTDMRSLMGFYFTDDCQGPGGGTIASTLDTLENIMIDVVVVMAGNVGDMAALPTLPRPDGTAPAKRVAPMSQERRVTHRVQSGLLEAAFVRGSAWRAVVTAAECAAPKEPGPSNP